MLVQIKKSFSKLSNYPRLRILLIIVVIIIIFIVMMNFLTPKTDTHVSSSVQPVSANQKRQTAKPVTTQASNQYNQLQAVNQQQQLQKAVNNGNTLFQGAFNNGQTSTDTSATPNSNQTTTASTQPATQAQTSPQQFANQQQNVPSPQLQRQLDQLQQKLQQQTSQDNQVSQIEGNMRTSVTNLTASWNIPTATTVQGTPPSTPQNSTATGSGPVMIKGGSILFGIVDTALNSDQPGTPVMATIVTGPYKGAKLLGAFQSEKDALVVQFNTMSLPTMNKTISINAYALDQNTANNAIATSVDNHYLLRYGMLFASAFLQGFGNAYQNYNYTCPPGTANCTLINSNGTPNTQATTKTATYQGLGQVGTTLGQVAAQQFNTPPTIKVDQGTGIGVLFMRDVSLPLN